MGPKKRKSGSQKSSAPKKRKPDQILSDGPPIGTGSTLAQETETSQGNLADPSLDDLDYVPRESDSRQLHIFFDKLAKGLYESRSGQTAVYTPPAPRAVHVLELAPVAGRRFELVKDEVGLVDQLRADGTSIKAWKIPIRDRLAVDMVQFDAFTVPPVRVTNFECLHCRNNVSAADRYNARLKCNRQRPCRNCKNTGREDGCALESPDLEVPEHTWLTETTCSAEHLPEIIQLGHLQAKILNRAPFEPDIRAWSAEIVFDGSIGGVRPAVVSVEQRFVDVNSLVEWKRRHFKAFDFSLLSPYIRLWVVDDNGLMRGNPTGFFDKSTYGEVRAPVKNLALHFTYVWNQSGGKVLEVAVSLSEDNFSSTDDTSEHLSDLDGYELFGKYFTAPTASTPPAVAALAERARKEPKLAHMLRVLQHGCAAIVGLVGSASQISAVFNDATAKYQDRSRTRIQSDGPLNGEPLFLTPHINQSTMWLGFSSSFYKLLRGKQTIQTPGTKVSTTVVDAACIAYAFRSALTALVEGKPPSWIAFALYKALYELESAMVTRDMVLEQAMSALDPADPQNTSFFEVCMHCNRLNSRDTMSWVSTVRGAILCCRQCSNSPYALHTFSRAPVDLLATLQQRLLTMFARDSRFYTPDWNVQDMAEHLYSKHHVPGEPLQYIHGFTGLPLPINPAGSRACLRMSIEKLHQRYGDQLHTYENITLVPHGLNLLHHTGPISGVPLCKQALVLYAREQERGPLGLQYHPELVSDWKRIEAALEHQRLISRLTPRFSRQRLAQKRSPALDEAIVEMERSGVWDGKTVLDSPTGPFATKAVLPASARYPKTDAFSAARWAELVALFKEMESSDQFNPVRNDGARTKLVWVGKNNDLPWIWPLEHLLTDVSPSWYWDMYSVEVRFMDTGCDPKHVTRESPDTLLLSDIRQYLLDGGRCHIFGWQRTCRIGYLSSASKGRGTYQSTANGERRLIRPGEHMVSGWTTLQPTSLADFDIHLCTIISESWSANVLRFNFAGDHDDLFPILKQSLLDCPDECKWYGPFQKEYAPIEGCPTWTETKAWYQAFYAGKTILTSQEQTDDQEATAMAAMMEDLLAAMQPSEDQTSSETIAERTERLSEAIARIAALNCHSDEQIQKLLESSRNSVEDPELFQQHFSALSTLLDSREEGQYRTNQREQKLAAMLERISDLGLEANTDVQDLLHMVTSSIDNLDSFEEHLKTLTDRIDLIESARIPKLNAVNLFWFDNSCFVNSCVQTMYSLPVFRRLVLEQDIIVGPSTKAVAMTNRLRQLFAHMGSGKGRIANKAEMDSYLTPIYELDPSSFPRGKQEDAAAMFTTIFDTLVIATAAAVPSEQVQRDRLALDVIQEALDMQASPPDNGLRSLSTDVELRWQNNLACAGDTPLYTAFALQVVEESECGQLGCGRVKRAISHTARLDLSFADRTSPTTLHELLRRYFRSVVDRRQPMTSIKSCTEQRHEGPLRAWKHITKLPHHLLLCFTRGNEGGKLEFANHADIPEFLDMDEYTAGAFLPSLNESSPSEGCIYRLAVLCMFRSNHYVTLALREGNWLFLDDLADTVAIKHPQQAINDGWIPYFIVYERQEGCSTLPKASDDLTWSTGFVLTKGGSVPEAVNEEVLPQATTMRYRCPMANINGCPRSFPSQEASIAHEDVCIVENGLCPHKFPCHLCSKSFATDNALVQHSLTHNRCENCLQQLSPGEEQQHFHCAQEKCDLVFHSQASAQQHEHCPLCNLRGGQTKGFRSPISLTNHVREDHEHRCKLCEEPHASPSDLLQHIHSAHQSCAACDEVFDNALDLEQHQQTSHAGSACDLCGSLYKNTELLTTHMATAHVACVQCNIILKQQSDLDDHVNSGHRPQEQLCRICGMTLLRPGSVNEHLAEHHQCPYCSEVLLNQEDRTKHIESQHSFICDTCGSRFASQDLLDDHVKDHVSWECLFCHDTFMTEALRDSHMEQNHLVAYTKHQIAELNKVRRALAQEHIERSATEKEWLVTRQLFEEKVRSDHVAREREALLREREQHKVNTLMLEVFVAEGRDVGAQARAVRERLAQIDKQLESLDIPMEHM